MSALVPRRILVVCCLVVLGYCALIPWLAFTLPNSYEVTDWPAVWMSLDGFELLLLVCTTWLLRRGSQYFVIPALIYAGVMMSDLLFDNLTAHGSSVGTARFDSLPELAAAGVAVWLVVKHGNLGAPNVAAPPKHQS